MSTKARIIVLMVLLLSCGRGSGPALAAPPDPAKPLPETLSVAVPENNGITVRRYQMSSDGSLTQISRSRLTSATANSLVALHFAPDGRAAYVRSGRNGKGALLQYRLNDDGSLAPSSVPAVPAGDLPADFRSTDPLTFSPDGRFAYALCQDGVWQYRVGPDDRLTPLAVPVIQTGKAPGRPDVRRDVTKPGDKFSTFEIEKDDRLAAVFLAVAPNGRFAYVINDETYFKGGEHISSFETSFGGSYAEAARTLVRLRVGNNGQLSPAGPPLPLPKEATSLTIAPDSRLVAVAGGGISLYRLAADGSIGARPAQTLPGEVACFNTRGDVLYVSQRVGASPTGLAQTAGIAQYRLSADGIPTEIGTAATLPEHGGDATQMTLDRTGHFLCWYYCASVFVHALRPDGTLAITPSASTPNFEWPGTISVLPGVPKVAAAPPVAVPAPGSDPHESAYVLNAGDSSISQFAVARDGTLTPLSPPTVKLGQIWGWHMAVDPAGRFLYVPHGLLRTLDLFRISADGTLAPLATPTITFPAPDVPEDARVDPSGHTLYVSEANDTGLYVFHIQQDGSLTPDPAHARREFSRINNWTINAATRLLAVQHDNDDLDTYRIAPDGSLTHLAHTQTNLGQPLTFTPDGRFAYYGTAGGEVWQFRVSPEGVVTENSPRSVPADNVSREVAVTPDGRFAYAVNQGDLFVSGDGGVSQYRVGMDGTLTPLTPPTLLTKTSPLRVTIDPAGRFLYALSSGAVSPFLIGADGRLTPLPPVTVPAASVLGEILVTRR